MRRKLQFFILCFSFFLVFDSLAFSKHYEFEEYGISFWVPDESVCKKTNIQEEEIYLKTYLYCELKDGDIVFILGNTSTPVEFDILYNLKRDDHEKVKKLIKIIESFKQLYINNTTIMPMKNINAVLFGYGLKTKVFDTILYRYGLGVMGINPTKNNFFIGVQSKMKGNEDIAFKKYTKFAKKYAQKVFDSVIFH